jgi:hypothetical protein
MRERKTLNEVGVDGRMNLKWISRTGMGACTGIICLGIGRNVGLCDFSNDYFAP